MMNIYQDSVEQFSKNISAFIFVNQKIIYGSRFFLIFYNLDFRIESAMLDALLKQKIVSKKTADRFNSKQAKRTRKLEKKKSKALRRGETFEIPADMAPTYEPDTTTVEDITKYFHFV